MLGGWRERLRHDVLGLGEAVGRSFFLSQRAALQYCSADYDAAHEAISAWLAHLEETRPINGKYRGPIMTEPGIAVDKAVALGHLALLEERRGRNDLAKQYWDRARREAVTAKWRDTSDQRMRAVVQHLDNCETSAPKQ